MPNTVALLEAEATGETRSSIAHEPVALRQIVVVSS